MEEISCSGEKSDVVASVQQGRKMYRVETFIIPRKLDGISEIFRSTEELDLDYHPDKVTEEEEEEEEEVGKENEEIVTLEFQQLSSNRIADDGVEESVSVNFGENSKPKDSTEGKESLCNIDKHDSEAGSSNRTPGEDFKRNYEGGGVDKLLRFDCTLNLQGEELGRSQSYDFLPSLKTGSDLKSIKEGCEISYGSCEELCHHGNKNGCTVAAQSPSQVSEEIFKENWMQRLEFLRRRVSLIRDKEVALQERERILLKKEKELRILERLVKEKIQRADLYLKRCTIRNSVNLEDDYPPQNFFLHELSRPSPPPYPERPHINPEENNPEQDSREILSAGSRTSNRSSNSTRSGSSRGEKDAKQICRETAAGTTRIITESSKNLPAGKITSGLNNNNPKTLDITQSVEGSKDLRRSKWSAYSSWRCRAKPKISYDDLDSTLSADIGDSSFAVTSKKLDPRLVRKPRGFSRSASERGPKNRPCSLDLDVDLGPDGERVLRKISENISAAATERHVTRFQDYGSIDIKRHRSEPKIDGLIQQEKIPAENNKNTLRTDPANSITGKDLIKSRKEKTTFWNEEASDWLRKKRQAYNLATKRIPNRDYENKENFGNSKNLHQISEKQSRTKNEKGRKFTIFR